MDVEKSVFILLCSSFYIIMHAAIALLMLDAHNDDAFGTLQKSNKARETERERKC